MLVLLVCLAPAGAKAQTAATLVGIVQDVQGGRLPGVTVLVRNLATAVSRELVTDGEGRFRATALSAGDYELRASLDPFRPLVQTGVRLTVGESAAVTLTMQVGAAEEVTVRGTSAVNTQTGELSFLTDQRTIEHLPVNGRNYTDLMQLHPSVNLFPHRDNGSVVAHGLAMSVNGQNPRANTYLLDGTLQNDFTNSPASSAAGTALGMDTIREFRLASNSYSAEYGRAAGGQINVITKSGTNLFSGGGFMFHRNSALDASNYFDGDEKPSFRRYQVGGTLGGPLRRDRMFVFVGYEGLYENLGRTIVTTVPDDNARLGILPTGQVSINPSVLPYLLEFPVANGPSLGGGLAQHRFGFDQRLDQNFFQGRFDAVPSAGAQLFARYTLDDAEQALPTDFPQFPRAFVSRNQFLTAEYRRALSSATFATARFGFSGTRIAQTVESNTTQAVSPFVPGQPTMGAIDIGGVPRFGPQLSADLVLEQDVYSGQVDVTHARGRHLLKAGALVERYGASEFNPTFSRGVYRFASLPAFLAGSAATFIGLTPDGDVNRQWDWTLLGAYLQDDWAAGREVTINAGLRIEAATVPVDPRDVNMPDLLAPQPTVGRLYENPGATFSPRVGAAWNIGGDDRTSLRGGYGLYYTINNQQELIVTVTNPPATPRVVIGGPSFPVPPFERAGGISVRPIQHDIKYPRVHVWNVNLQRRLPADWVASIGYAGSRGLHIWRNADVNVPEPLILEDGTPFYPAGLTRPNPNFSAIELKASDGDSWYKAIILEAHRQWSRGLQVQTSYTWSKTEDTTQNATFFSDSTTSLVSAMPEVIPGYNKGLSDFHAEHNFVLSAIWQIPTGFARGSVASGLFSDWQVASIVRMRSGNPLSVFVQTNRSRSLWAPSLGPGTGPDRPSYAPGRGADDAVRGNPDAWFDPAAFVLAPVGTLGNVGRNELIGPDLRTTDLSFTKSVPFRAVGPSASIQLRVEVFNLFNRVNFGPPSLVAFSGTGIETAPLASFGQIRRTTTSARQMQLGVRVTF
ncbi:MAG TPA: carboxypeptidase regulatory-like domain-containing protein [Planctomycetaceae bacterium]|nr:carboxypeptidase regulatory-like domain-containing protein [Planctomycetaceae bacterium]